LTFSCLDQYHKNHQANLQPAPRSPSRPATNGVYGSGPLLDLFVDHDHYKPFPEIDNGAQPAAQLGKAPSPKLYQTDFSAHDDDFLTSPDHTSGNYLVGKPSDACLEIINHEGLVRQIMIQEFAEDPANCQRCVAFRSLSFLRLHASHLRSSQFCCK
jgi:hypothetical protein